jgi:putative ABC transport system substrate-binding protein
MNVRDPGCSLPHRSCPSHRTGAHRARRNFIVIALAAIAAPVWAAPVKRIGVFLNGDEEQTGIIVSKLAKALRAHGWREGVNLEFVPVALAGNPPPEAAAALVRGGVDAVFTADTPRTRLLQGASRTMPIVTVTGDPVLNGFAASLARPGSNVTGLAFSLRDIQLKSLELARALVPKLSRLRIFSTGADPELKSQQTLVGEAQRTGVAVEWVRVLALEDLIQGFKRLSIADGGVAFISALPFGSRQVGELALARKVATLSPYKQDVRDGLLASYSKDFADEMSRIAAVMDKVLRGVKPAEIAFEQPNQTHIAINKRTAAALGLAIPPEVLLRADEVVQ